MKEEINSACFAKLPFRVRHHVLTQEEIEEEAVLSANLKRNFSKFTVYTNFLLMLLTDNVMQWYCEASTNREH